MALHTKKCEKCHFVFENEVEKCMCLPNGMTCFNCKHFQRCSNLFGATTERKDCDFYPIRFKAKEV